jgi:hypothetical protein
MTGPRLEWVLASVRSGYVVREAEGGVPELLRDLAAALPEMLLSLESGFLERVAAQLDPEGGTEGFSEVLLLSHSHVHVIQPLASRRGEALVATAPAGRSVGLVLSQVHARADELESEP